jgi:hypothetical protein
MIPTRPHRAKWIHAEGACSVYKSHLVDCMISHNIRVSRIVVQTSRRGRTMLISLRFLQCEELTPVKASTARPSVMEYPFCRITMGSSTTDFEPGSLVLLMEAMPIAETTKSNEWTTRGNRINPEASARTDTQTVQHQPVPTKSKKSKIKYAYRFVRIAKGTDLLNQTSKRIQITNLQACSVLPWSLQESWH